MFSERHLMSQVIGLIITPKKWELNMDNYEADT